MQRDKLVQNPGWGYFYVISAAVLWASSGSAAKFLFNGGVTTFQVMQLRLTLAAAVLCLVLGLRRRDLLRIDLNELPYFISLGALAMAGVQFCYLLAISRINVAAAILLQYLAPSLIALFTIVVVREKLSWPVLIALVCATIGCYLVVGAYDLNLLSLNRIGIVAGLLSAVTFAWYSLQGEYGMRRHHPLTIHFYAILFAAVTWNIIYPPLEAFRHAYRSIEWFWILYIALFGTLVPFWLYFAGINLIRSARASITATLEPITAGLLSYLFLGEVMAPLQIFGGILVIASVILLQLKREQDRKTPALLKAQNGIGGT